MPGTIIVGSKKNDFLENPLMSELSLSEAQLKDLMKTAILEIFQEQRGFFQELVTEAMEDIALIKAIDEGKDSDPVERDAIFAILEQPE